MTTLVLTYAGSFLILLVNVIWYRTKFLLKKKGYQVSWFSKHLDDYPSLLKAINNETDEVKLSKLVFQKKLMLSIWGIFPLGALLIFIAAEFKG